MVIIVCYRCNRTIRVEFWPEHDGRTEVSHGLHGPCAEAILQEDAVTEGLLRDAAS